MDDFLIALGAATFVYAILYTIKAIIKRKLDKGIFINPGS